MLPSFFFVRHKGSEAVQNVFTPHKALGGSGYAIQLAKKSLGIPVV